MIFLFFYIMIIQIKKIKFFRTCHKDIKSFIRILSVFYPRKIWESRLENMVAYGNVCIIQPRWGIVDIAGYRIKTSDMLTTEMFKKVKEML